MMLIERTVLNWWHQRQLSRGRHLSVEMTGYTTLVYSLRWIVRVGPVPKRLALYIT